MIITVTPNPSVDRTLEIEELTLGAVLRASASHVDPGGKGVNVARAAAMNGRPAMAVFPSGGAEGDHLARLLADVSVRVTAVPIAGSIRSNVAIVEPDGTTTKINERGPTLAADDVDRLVEATAQTAEAHSARWVALCGSLPPGAPKELYAQIVQRLRGLDVRVAVDTSGAPLRHAVEAGAGLVKPNREELEEATGRQLTTLGDALEAATTLREQGARSVLVSLGADGALLATHESPCFARAKVRHPRSTVGAGDALLAGYLSHADPGSEDALVQGVAWGAAAVSLPGTTMPGPEDLMFDAVEHGDVDEQQVLQE